MHAYINTKYTPVATVAVLALSRVFSTVFPFLLFKIRYG